MKITVLTLFPKMIEGFFNESIINRAKGKGLVTIELVNLRDYAVDSYGTVDDKPYGGGAGMVMRVDVIDKAIQSVGVGLSGPSQKGEKTSPLQKIIYTSPKGILFNQQKAQEYSTLDSLVILCGHYEGVDERVMEFVDEEVSLGDVVMTGGEITAAAIIDAVVRLIPNVLKKEEATAIESFFEVRTDILSQIVHDERVERLQEQGVTSVRLLEYPHYTRPEVYQGKKIPTVLLSGNHQEIEQWRLEQAYKETVKKRPDLLEKKA